MKTSKLFTEVETAELPKLPDSWEWTKLGEITYVNSGNTPKSLKKAENKGQFPFYKVSDMNSEGNETWMKTSNLYLTTDEKVLFKVKEEQKGTIIFPKRGGAILTNKKRRLSCNAAYDLNIMGVKEASKNILNDFLWYWLSKLDLRKLYDGSNVPQINNRDIEPLFFPLPPLPEQRAIVSKIEQLFSELDNGISNLKLTQEQLKVYRQAVLKKAFEGELTKKWREQQTDLPDAGDLLEQIRKDREEAAKVSGSKGKKIKPLTETELADLPIIPKKWMWIKLDSLGDLGRGKSKHRPRNDKILFGGKYPFIQTGEVKAANHIIKSFEKTYSDVGLAQSKLWPKGTLCITIAANIAETAFLGFESCFPDSIVGFTAAENIVMKEYIYYFFKDKQSKIEAFAPATAQKNINLTTLENLIIPYCSLLEQQVIVQEIETRLSVCDKIEQDIETNLEKAEALRQSILKKAFEGKLLNEKELAEVRGAEDWEPAEVLLERIRAERAKNGEKLLQICSSTENI